MSHVFNDRRAVETWARDAAGEITEAHTRALADAIIKTAHDLGLRYGDAWDFLAMPEAEWLAMIDASQPNDALARAGQRAADALTDFVVQVLAPQHLREAGLGLEAEKLRTAPCIVDAESLSEVLARLGDVRAVTSKAQRAPWESEGRWGPTADEAKSARLLDETEAAFCKVDLREVERILGPVLRRRDGEPALQSAWGQAVTVVYEAIRTATHKRIT